MIIKQKSITPWNVCKHVLLVALMLFQLFPLIVLLLNTFRTDTQIKQSPLAWPEQFSLINYVETWIKGSYAIAFRNSIFIGICVIVGVVSLAGLAAYGLARLRMPVKDFFIGYFMFAMSFPAFMFIVPLYYTFSTVGLSNTHTGLIIIYTAIYIPFSMLLIRTFLVGIPRELEEAGKIDGCGEFTVFLRITMPLALPILMTVSLIVFVWSWNEFLWANTFLTLDDMRTVSTRFYKFTGEWSTDLAKIYTAGMIALAPIIVLYLLLQKSFIEGLTQGSVKG